MPADWCGTGQGTADPNNSIPEFIEGNSPPGNNRLSKTVNIITP